MAAIGGWSTVGGAYTTGALFGLAAGLGTAGAGTSSGAGRSTAGGSSFGPAYLLGGLLGGKPTVNYSGSLYSALAAYPSAAGKERTAALKSAAAKIDAGDLASGRAQAQGVLDKNPRDPAALAVVAHAYLKEQDYKEAERYYARAVALAPSSSRLQSSLRNVRTLQKGDDEVLSIARRMLAGPYTRSDGLRLLFHLTERSPDSVEAYLALAEGFTAARKPLQVLGSLQEALAAADSSGDLDKVITRARAFVAEHGQVGLGHNLLGRALVKAGRTDEGLRELKIATEVAPDNAAYAEDVAGGYIERAAARVEAGKLTSARADLDAAFAINPSDSGYREVAARLSLAQAGKEITGYRYNRALLELNRAYSAAPDAAAFKKRLAALYVRVARYYDNKDDESLARICYTKAYELDPSSTLARRYTAQLSHETGLDYLDKSIHVKALEHLQRAHQTEPANQTYKKDLARAYHGRGLELERQNKLTEAITAYEQGFLLDPSNTALGTDLSEAINQRDGA